MIEMPTKPRQYDTSKETIEKVIGIKITDKQYGELMTINLNMQTIENPVPVHHVLLILRTLGLIGNRDFTGDEHVTKFGQRKTD